MSPDGLHFLEHYGVVILPALTVAEQIGLPLPAVPALRLTQRHDERPGGA